ncbi:DUF3017 domain-containing protein [Gordonia sp. CPCC 205333]|uniref:DUF3017 domain-containing protein n=1 Tax=Gordonia sp. CPCC 205333 TaxID=3140790 RepID=UPI003AF363CF
MAEQPALDDRTDRIRRARQLRRYIVQIPYFIVLGVIGVAAILVIFGFWRKGALVFSGALLLGATFRALLPVGRVGLLQVRSRFFDVSAMASMGLLMLWLASSIAALGTD